MKYLIGIDIGTTGTKSVLFDLGGNAVASSTAEYPLSQPQNGWAEQDPNDWWQAACKTLGEVVKHATDGEIAGVGLSGQMHSLVLLDENNCVIRPAILWCDGRTTAECAEIEATVGKDKLVEITANPALPGFTASKLMWVKKHEPQNFARVAHILLAKDYIRFKLTGEYATEASDASGMQLLDVKNRCWSEELCGILGIDTSTLARVYESSDVTGYVSAEAAALTGLPKGLPVAGGAGDNAAAAIGSGVYQLGQAFTTIGTSGVVFAPTDTPLIDPLGRVHTFCAAVPNTWHVMGVTQAAGLSLNWFRSQFAANVTYKEIDRVCQTLPIGAERLLYLPYLMGERTPLLDSNARGVFFGLSAMHDKFHLARAVMEGVSYSLYSCLELIGKIGIDVKTMMLCGGGAKSAFWQQMLTDLYGMPIHVGESSEGAALGAAILAGCAAGVYPSVEDGCRSAVRSKLVFDPNEQNHDVYMQYYALYNRLYPSLKEHFADLQGI
jgi:xylulokinase